ncbi:DEAD/DEAH box helicase [Vibrio owensii]|uniref:DEAD/DEAH box helicase n=1 Tax=Vibrio harveyi group TaxID=717610 RepID=UPI003CC62D69
MNESKISKKFLTAMTQLGVDGLESLLLYLPDKYKDYRFPETNLQAFMDTDEAKLFKLKLLRSPEVDEIRKMTKLSVSDGMTTVSVIFFGPSSQFNEYKAGDIIHIEGKVVTNGPWVNLKSAKLIRQSEIGRIMPVYRGKEKVVSPQLIAKNMSIALLDHFDLTKGHILSELNTSEKDLVTQCIPEIGDLKSLFRMTHRPATAEDVDQSIKGIRMINAYKALKNALSSSYIPEQEGSRIKYSVEAIKQAVSKLPFTPTQDQKQSIWDITKDLNSPYPMDRLLSGDVGCGKTVTYAIPAVCSHLAGKNVVIISPNSLLSEQVAQEIKETWPEAHVELLVGNGKPRSTKFEGNPIIVGTTAILHWMKNINYDHKIDLLIIDEQQKLGTAQKELLTQPTTNVLEATATAIPRTAALMKYGGKKVSYLTQCPVEKTIKSIIVGTESQKRVFNTLKKIIDDGYQIAVLYPVRQKDYMFFDIHIKGHNIEELKEYLLKIKVELGDGELQEICGELIFTAKLKRIQQTKLEKFLAEREWIFDLKERPDLEDIKENKRNVEDAAKMWEKLYPGQVVMLHGGLSLKEKMSALEIAKAGKCKVIVTSSVIEIGLTMPDLRGLLVKNADIYGASTLHQFRGRLARKGGRGLFMLGVESDVADADEMSLARLNLLVDYTKGFEIAEHDMKQRGFGNLAKSGQIQSGHLDGIFKGIKVLPQDIENLMKAA